MLLLRRLIGIGRHWKARQLGQAHALEAYVAEVHAMLELEVC